jgi:lipase
MSDWRVVARLTVADWGPPAAPVVLALHGLTSTSQVWGAMAKALPGIRVVAPDLPGRGGSEQTPAKPGLPGHAQAVLRVADELALRDVVVVGHSMGAFLAPLVAAKLGDRARRVVLLDGGIPPDRSPLLGRAVIRATFWLAARRLDRRWDDLESYAKVAEGDAIANRPDLHPAMLEWAGHMLGGPPGAQRPRLLRSRLTADAADSLAGPPTLDALAGSATPVHAIAATHGATDKAKPFLSDAALARGKQLLPRLTTERVEANHVTLLFDQRVFATVAGR